MNPTFELSNRTIVQDLNIKLGRYEIVNEIARGGMAHVYKGRLRGAQGFEKTVAIKKILNHWSEDEQFKNLLIEEAKLLVRLNHPNIVQVIELGEENEIPFLVMEYIHGIDLKHLIRESQKQNKQIPLPLFFYIAREITKGLVFAQGLLDDDGFPIDVIHRDISPQNILISYSGDVKITDFGIAKICKQNQNTHTGHIKGKFSYMAPEQARGDHLSRQTDIYSLGVVLFEMITGQKLFHHVSDLKILEMARLAQWDLSPLKDHPVYPIVSKCLQFDPTLRYQNAAELLDDLDSLQSNLSLRSYARDLALFISQIFPTKPHFTPRTIEASPALITAIKETKLLETSEQKTILNATQVKKIEPQKSESIFLDATEIDLNAVKDRPISEKISHTTNLKNQLPLIFEDFVLKAKDIFKKIKIEFPSLWINYRISILTCLGFCFITPLILIFILQFSETKKRSSEQNWARIDDEVKAHAFYETGNPSESRSLEKFTTLRLTANQNGTLFILKSGEKTLILNDEVELELDPYQQSIWSVMAKKDGFRPFKTEITIPELARVVSKEIKMEPLGYGEVKVITRPWGSARFEKEAKSIGSSIYEVLEGSQTIRVYYPPLKRSLQKTIQVTAGQKITCRASFKKEGSTLFCQ